MPKVDYFLGPFRLGNFRITFWALFGWDFPKGPKKCSQIFQLDGCSSRWGPCRRRMETCAGRQGYIPLGTDPFSEVVWC